MGADRPGASPRRRRSLSYRCLRHVYARGWANSTASQMQQVWQRPRRGVKSGTWTLDEGGVSMTLDKALPHAAVQRGSRATTSHLVARRTDSYAALPPESRRLP